MTINFNLGFLGLLTIALIIAKLAHWINVSWWLVFSPMILGIVILLFIIFITILIVEHGD